MLNGLVSRFFAHFPIKKDRFLRAYNERERLVSNETVLSRRKGRDTGKFVIK